MRLSSQAVHGKVGSDEPWLSAVKYLHQEYAKTRYQIVSLEENPHQEKYLHQEYVKTQSQIGPLQKYLNREIAKLKSYRSSGKISGEYAKLDVI